MRANLLAAARQHTLLADGAMGTQLQLAGLEPGGCGDLWNLEQPERVLDIQQRYVAAGTQILLTNTFGSNRFVLARYDAQDLVVSCNLAGAAIARKAAGDDVFVLGDIGPFGGFVAPLGEHAEDDVHAAFLEQARALLDGRVDGIIVETMTAVEEVVLAIRAAKSAGAPFVIASMSFDATRAGLRTMMGTTPEQAAEAMLAAGADALAANCGTALTMGDFADIARRYRAVAGDVIVMIEPNAGQPELVGDDVVYREDPAVMTAHLHLLLDAGVNIIGGCCGTTPDHIRAFGHALGRRDAWRRNLELTPAFQWVGTTPALSASATATALEVAAWSVASIVQGATVLLRMKSTALTGAAHPVLATGELIGAGVTAVWLW